MVAIVTLVFAICWLPITLYIISANVFQHRTPLLYYFKILANSFAYLNSAINPILYAFLNRSFRNNCGSLFSKRSWSMLCRKEVRTKHVHQRRPPMDKRTSSAQIDRFSYQSTNCQSAPSFYPNKKKPFIVVTSPNRLSADMTSRNDFSDGDYETVSDVEPRSTRSSRILSIDEKNRSNTLTTSL